MEYNVNDVVLVRGVAFVLPYIYFPKLRQSNGQLENSSMAVVESEKLFECQFKAVIKSKDQKNILELGDYLYKVEVFGNYNFNLFASKEGYFTVSDLKRCYQDDILCTKCNSFCYQQCFKIHNSFKCQKY